MAAFSAYILGLLFAGDAVAFRVQGVKPIQVKLLFKGAIDEHTYTYKHWSNV